MTRRIVSRRVVLPLTFTMLAMGGVAACDNGEVEEGKVYCTDTDGVVVDEDRCDDADGGGGFFFLHYGSNAVYPNTYRPGDRLPSGGQRFAVNDKAARAKFNLPPTGRISNGSTVKTNVVGKGGGGTTGKSGGSGGG